MNTQTSATTVAEAPVDGPSTTVHAYQPDGTYAGPVTLGKGDVSPLEPGLVWLIPAYCTDVAPPTPGPRQVPVWDGTAWALQEVPEPVIEPEQPPTPERRTCTPLEFIERFTDAEQLAIVTAAMTEPRLRLWYDKLMAASFVDLDDARLLAGVEALVVAGLITSQRRAEVLA
jgi:hypothetical protein